jgi:hypothetical protein
MIMKNYVADELANKVYHLHKALEQAESIISALEQDNKNLKDALNNLAYINKEDYVTDSETFDESLCSAV